jgi:hypothetical protein
VCFYHGFFGEVMDIQWYNRNSKFYWRVLLWGSSVGFSVIFFSYYLPLHSRSTLDIHLMVKEFWIVLFWYLFSSWCLQNLPVIILSSGVNFGINSYWVWALKYCVFVQFHLGFLLPWISIQFIMNVQILCLWRSCFDRLIFQALVGTMSLFCNTHSLFYEFYKVCIFSQIFQF